MSSFSFEILVALALLALTACNMHVDKQQNPVQGSWYAQIEDRVLKPHCLSCHSGAAPAGDIDLTSYDAVLASGSVVPGDAEASSFYQSVVSGKMPKGKAAISQDDVDRIFKWIQAGAKKTETQVAQGPQPTFRWIHASHPETG